MACVICDHKTRSAKCNVCNGTQKYVNLHGEEFPCPNCQGLGYITLAFCPKCWKLMKILEKYPKTKKITSTFWRSKYYGGALLPEHWPKQPCTLLLRSCIPSKDLGSCPIREIIYEPKKDLTVVKELCTLINSGDVTGFLEIKIK